MTAPTEIVETNVPGAASSELVLTLDCPETLGIVHAVSGVLLDHGCNIVELTQFDDRRRGHFFMRVHVAPMAGAPWIATRCIKTWNRWRNASR